MLSSFKLFLCLISSPFTPCLAPLLSRIVHHTHVIRSDLSLRGNTCSRIGPSREHVKPSSISHRRKDITAAVAGKHSPISIILSTTPASCIRTTSSFYAQQRWSSKLTISTVWLQQCAGPMNHKGKDRVCGLHIKRNFVCWLVAYNHPRIMLVYPRGRSGETAVHADCQLT